MFCLSIQIFHSLPLFPAPWERQYMRVGLTVPIYLGYMYKFSNMCHVLNIISFLAVVTLLWEQLFIEWVSLIFSVSPGSNVCSHHYLWLPAVPGDDTGAVFFPYPFSTVAPPPTSPANSPYLIYTPYPLPNLSPHTHAHIHKHVVLIITWLSCDLSNFKNCFPPSIPRGAGGGFWHYSRIKWPLR